jgi:type I site-specific restriction endonuclease
MWTINLPPYPTRKLKTLETGDVMIYDEWRRRYVILTPEEWVRQHFIHFLVSKGYAHGRFAVEQALKIGSKSGRFDALYYGKNGKPTLLIECKAPHIEISQSTINQIAQYNRELRAPFLAVTNGLKSWFLSLSGSDATFLKTIPNPETW